MQPRRSTPISAIGRRRRRPRRRRTRWSDSTRRRTRRRAATGRRRQRTTMLQQPAKRGGSSPSPSRHPRGSPLVAVTADGTVLSVADAAATPTSPRSTEIGASRAARPDRPRRLHVQRRDTAPPRSSASATAWSTRPRPDRRRPDRTADPPRQRVDLDQRPRRAARSGSPAPTPNSIGSTTGATRSARRATSPTRIPGDEEDGNTEENPDIGEIRDPEIDEDGVNEPPVARDDVARTRADQPVVVDLVANDEDPDGDALMVAGARRRARRGGRRRHRRRGIGAGRAAAGIHRQHRFLVHGQRRARRVGRRPTSRSRSSSNDASNRPPVAQTDIAEVRGGASAAFNVLNNDSDPDGDTFVLE